MIFFSKIGAAVGMIIQKALASRDMNNICDHKYIKMAYEAENMNPQLQQVLRLLNCKNTPDQQHSFSTTISNPTRIGFPTTTPSFSADDDDENEEDNTNDQDDNLESVHLPPEKESKIQQLLNIARGEKGAKRNFLKSLFRLNKKDKTFKQGQKLPSSSYKLDKDDANSLKNSRKRTRTIQ